LLIQTSSAHSDELVEIQVNQLHEMDHTMSASMLVDIDARSKAWMRVAQEHLRHGERDKARMLLETAVQSEYAKKSVSRVLLTPVSSLHSTVQQNERP
jgi:hypothetical protein